MIKKSKEAKQSILALTRESRLSTMANSSYQMMGAASSNKSLDDLGTRIINTFQYSRFPTRAAPRHFTPAGELDGLITRDSIIQVLSDTTRSAAAEDPLINFILHHGKKLLASSIMARLKGAELYYAMCKFMQDNISDDDLPLANPRRGPEEGHKMLQSGWARSWNPMNLHSFMEHQWSFLALNFKNHPPGDHLKLDSHHILPFLEATEEVQGGSSRVYKVTIHPSHMAPWFESNEV